jgi:phosphoribosylglycinamide formyltransferase-1
VPLGCGDERDPLHVVVFVSGGGGNLAAVLEVAAAHPHLVQAGLVVADRLGTRAVEIARAAGVPTVEADFEAACGRWSDSAADPGRAARYRRAAEEFHDGILDQISAEERRRGHRIGLVILSYRRWIHGRLLRRFEGHMINQHAGDLATLDEFGRRRYRGIDPVRLALDASERRTRTSTIMVRAGHDAGEILCQGPWVPFDGEEITNATATAHEQRQKRESDWPSLRFALYEIACGHYAISPSIRHPDGCCTVLHRGVALPYCGIDLEYVAAGAGA